MKASISPPPKDAVNFCDFVTHAPTPFHAVAHLTTRLFTSGFVPISERSSSASLEPGGKYYYTRNQSSLVAFTLPAKPLPETAISFAVGHLDSPCLKVRPVSKKTKSNYLQVGVELYGGGIWHSWFDRDLSLAGRVIVANREALHSDDPKFVSKLVKIDRPILRIPTLAIHLDRTANDSFTFNKETEFQPILGLVEDALNATDAALGMKRSHSGTPHRPLAKDDSHETEKSDDLFDVANMEDKHHPKLLAVLAEELGCDIADIQDFELSLFDTQPSTVGGLSNEFVYSPRIDNLMTSFCTIEALCEAVKTSNAEDESNIRCVILFDNEEVGSVSHHGAESNLLPAFVERIVQLKDYKDVGYYTMLANSFLISADMGHAIHPNYESRYETNLAPKINGGIVIKTNANQRYTSNAQTTFLLRRVAKKAGVPVQEFEIRNDSSCGSTVGPHLSTHVRTVDIGLAQLSMHSIRETAGSHDVRHYIDFFKVFFHGFGEIDRELRVDWH
ncbi:aspartyl aminopeptidase [Cryptococcus deuterogattii LA55]|nr:aspartyl aminopeptidase [Cryptococcus deuterogattii LA55]KIR95605.1 aspartyl aminopeptidase [Cryptococcus deuterogattii CBS 10090]KIS02101.1 aspartyl aminopeptidase [Cryptococcus deuterogattii 2001/935-1]